MKGIPWTPAEKALLRRVFPRYKEGEFTGYGLRGMFRGRSMSAISKKYWSIYGKSGKRKGLDEINQIKFDFAQEKLPYKTP